MSENKKMNDLTEEEARKQFEEDRLNSNDRDWLAPINEDMTAAERLEDTEGRLYRSLETNDAYSDEDQSNNDDLLDDEEDNAELELEVDPEYLNSDQTERKPLKEDQKHVGDDEELEI